MPLKAGLKKYPELGLKLLVVIFAILSFYFAKTLSQREPESMLIIESLLIISLCFSILYIITASIKLLKNHEKNLNFGGVGRTNIMTYKFVNVFPLAINSIPVSYDTSRLLKCTVAMAYSRYFVTQGATGKVKTIQPSTDARGRDFDNQFFGLGTEDPPTIFSVDPFVRGVVERNRSTQIGDFNLSPIGW